MNNKKIKIKAKEMQVHQSRMIEIYQIMLYITSFKKLYIKN